MPDGIIDGKEGEEEKPAPPATPAVDVGKMREEIGSEIDAKLQARDQALLQSVRELMEPLARREAAPAKDEQKGEEFSTTPEEFWKDPNTALQRFFDAKVAPLKQQTQERGVDPAAVVAFVEVQKSKIKEKAGPENWAKYEPFFDAALAKTDPRILLRPDGIDSIWRLTRSHADEFLENKERTEQDRRRKATLESSGGVIREEPKKVELNSNESYVAAQMGIAPELYKQYEVAEEIEIGGNRKKKK